MKKIFTSSFQLKGTTTGEFSAEFATLMVIDHDGDVTRPGAFQNGQETLIEAWNHGYGDLPVGKGTIHERGNKAVVEGAFFLNTESGKEHYQVVKNLGSLQEWSYSFGIIKASHGQFEGKDVQFLEKLDIYGIAPVQKGAGIDTRTTSIKSAGFSTADIRQEIDALQSGGRWLGKMSPASIRAQINQMQPPDVLKSALDDVINSMNDQEYQAISKRLKAAGGSILDAWRQVLKREGHSDPWTEAIIEAEIAALERQILDQNPTLEYQPGAAHAMALRFLSRPAKPGDEYPEAGVSVRSPIF